MSETLTLSLKPKTKARLLKKARYTQQSPDSLAELAIERMIAGDEEKDRAIAAALKEAEKGEWVSEEAMDNWVNSWGSDNELPIPKPDIFLKQS